MPATDLSVSSVRIVGQFVETVSEIGPVRFEKLERGSTYFHPQASHRQRFAFEANGREYWGEIIRTRIGNARGYSVEVELMTRNARTGHGVNVREGALILYREALAKAFRAHIESHLAEVEAAPAVEPADAPATGEARVVGYIDLTPTWSEILPTMLHVMEYAEPDGKEAIRGEFVRMAALADKYVAAQKALKETIS